MAPFSTMRSSIRSSSSGVRPGTRRRIFSTGSGTALRPSATSASSAVNRRFRIRSSTPDSVAGKPTGRASRCFCRRR